MTRFGYLVPEFPGQTHAFFWREILALRELGQEPELVSTRLPRNGIAPHKWCTAAVSQTSYLSPPSPRILFGAIATLVRGSLGYRKTADAIMKRLRARNSHGSTSTVREAVLQISLMMAGAELAGLARRRQWTHIHVHSLAEAAQTALYAHLLTGIPYSFTMHGSLADYGPNQPEKWRHAEFAIVITQELLREAQNSLEGNLPPELGVAPMGVDVGRFTRVGPYPPWNGQGPARIFSCGRLNPSKGHDDLLRAIRLLLDDGFDVRLRIAGEDDASGRGYRRELTGLLRTLGLDTHVDLIGLLSEDDVRAELEEAHVFTLASHAEPLGVATMEAMAMEVPVVATDAGGVRELVRDGIDGLLVPARRPDCMAAALSDLLSHPDTAWGMGAAARLRVADAFSSRRSAQVLAQLMEQSSHRHGSDG